MILVVGATGLVGGSITHRLLREGKPVRILTRQQSDYQPLIDAGAQPVLGDLKDRASLDAACQGIDTVITTASSVYRSGDDNPQTVEVEGNRNLIDAARAAGVEQFIFVSTLGASADSPVPYVAGKGQAEDYLRESGIPYTVLAPNAFMQGYIDVVVGKPAIAGAPVILVGEGRRKHTFVSAEDVAAFATAAVSNPAAVNQHIVIGGPEAISWRDAVAAYERELGRDVSVRVGEPSDLPAGLSDIQRAFVPFMETYDSTFDTSETADTYGVKLTTLEEFVRWDVARMRG